MLFLDQSELVELTGRKRHDAQHTQLNRMGITHKIRADGMPIVMRSHLAKELNGYEPSRPEQEPNWSMVNA